MGHHKTDPGQIRSAQADRSQTHQCAWCVGRDHLPDAERRSVESTPPRVSRRQFGPSHVPAVDQTPRAGTHRESLGPGLRGIGRRRLAMAVGRYGPGQSSDGGDRIGPNPTDRAKNGVKRSVLVEADGGPLAAVVAPANRNDQFLLEQTIEAIVVDRPEPTKQAPQHLCLDKGYDNPTGHQVAEDYHYTPHIRRIGEEPSAASGQKKYPARRWVVERTLGWLSKCRAILVRYDKKSSNYLGLIKLACALLWYRRLYVLSGD